MHFYLHMNWLAIWPSFLFVLLWIMHILWVFMKAWVCLVCMYFCVKSYFGSFIPSTFLSWCTAHSFFCLLNISLCSELWIKMQNYLIPLFRVCFFSFFYSFYLPLIVGFVGPCSCLLFGAVHVPFGAHMHFQRSCALDWPHSVWFFFDFPTCLLLKTWDFMPNGMRKNVKSIGHL